jgi:hypothetical protein
MKKSSSTAEAVADPPNCENALRVGRIVFDLPPEVGDVHVAGALIRNEHGLPHVLEDLAA